MLRTHFRLAFRQFRKRFGFSSISLGGLAVGFAGCLLVGGYVLHEFAFDRMHPDGDRLYRISTGAYGRAVPDNARTPVGLASAIESRMPEVDEAVEVYVRSAASVQSPQFSQVENRTLLTDSRIFDLFNIAFIQGRPESSLTGPGKVVLTETTALRYFGRTRAVGRTLRINLAFGFEDYEVTGIVEDPPSNTHFRFDFLLSIDSFSRRPERPMWHALSAYTYVKLGSSGVAGNEGLRRSLNEFMETSGWPEMADNAGLSTVGELVASERAYRLLPQRVDRIRTGPLLENELASWHSVAYLKTLLLIAGILLLVAVFNYVNLATARGAERQKEIGIRKAIGAFRGQLVRQHLSEAVVFSILAFALGLVLVFAAAPTFQALTNTHFSFAGLLTAPRLVAALVFAVVVGLLAGSYPGFVLAQLQPSESLTGSNRTRPLSAGRFRAILVGAQFAVSILLIGGLGVVSQQTRFLLEKDLRFNPEEVVVLNRTNQIGFDEAEAFRSRVEAVPAVVEAAYFEGIPGQWAQGDTYGTLASSPGNEVLLTRTPAGEGFQSALGLEIVQGRGFVDVFAVDSTSAVLNEAAVRALGIENPVGETIRLELSPPAEYRISGVVRDFHFNSLHESIRPLIIYREYSGSTPDNLVVRVSGANAREAIAGLQQAWNAFMPDEPATFLFLDERIAALYEAERRTVSVLGITTGLSILIGLLGLIGLTAHAVRVRLREIAVRIVFGAGERHIYWLFARRVLAIFTAAFVLAAPVGWITLEHWMQGFAYRATLSPWPLAGLVFGLMALVAAGILIQTRRAAGRNPASVLQSE